jgi:K+/H+ antiporter YhaU regulatory subunit KhtT
MGIKRREDYLMNPEPQEVLEQDDIVIVAGETERLKQFVESFNTP